jgi:hypothetical protein
MYHMVKSVLFQNHLCSVASAGAEHSAGQDAPIGVAAGPACQPNTGEFKRIHLHACAECVEVQVWCELAAVPARVGRPVRRVAQMRRLGRRFERAAVAYKAVKHGVREACLDTLGVCAGQR